MGDRIATGIPFLDFFFHGGFEVPGFVHVYGEPGTGKSTLGYQLVKSVHEQDDHAIWLDFNASFSTKRLLSIAKDATVLDSLTLISITSRSYFLTVLPTIISVARDAKLFVLDNFTYFYQLSDTTDKHGEFYLMYQQLVRLFALLRRNHMLGLLINQVRSTAEGDFYPIGGQLINEISRYVLAIRHNGDHNDLEIKKGKANQETLSFILLQEGWSVLPDVTS